MCTCTATDRWRVCSNARCCRRYATHQAAQYQRAQAFSAKLAREDFHKHGHAYDGPTASSKRGHFARASRPRPETEGGDNGRGRSRDAADEGVHPSRVQPPPPAASGPRRARRTGVMSHSASPAVDVNVEADMATAVPASHAFTRGGSSSQLQQWNASGVGAGTSGRVHSTMSPTMPRNTRRRAAVEYVPCVGVLATSAC